MTDLAVLGRIGVRTAWVGLAALGRLAELKRSERWSRDVLGAFQREKLVRLVGFALAHSEAYASLVHRTCGASVEELGPQVLDRLPIMTKDFVRNSGRLLLCSRRTRFGERVAFTGGSTGEPLRVVKGFAAMVWSEAVVYRGQGWAGVEPAASGVYLKATGTSSWRGRLRQRLGGFRSIAAFPVDDRTAARVVGAAKRLRAAFVSGYPSVLSLLAERMDGMSLGVPVVFTTGEMLRAGQRRALSSTLGARIVDYYGSNEVSGIAFECEAGSKHISEEHVIVETVDEGGAPVRGIPGRILVTDLDNFAMPFIRYEIGDLGVISDSPCSCGRALTVLERIDGRAQDRLRGRDGRELPALFFAARFRDLPGVRAYQLVQVDLGRVELRFVPASPDADTAIQAVAEEIRRHLGVGVVPSRVTIEELTLTARGKVRLVVGNA